MNKELILTLIAYHTGNVTEKTLHQGFDAVHWKERQATLAHFKSEIYPQIALHKARQEGIVSC